MLSTAAPTFSAASHLANTKRGEIGSELEGGLEAILGLSRDISCGWIPSCGPSMSSSVASLTSWSPTPMTLAAPPRTSGSCAGVRGVPTIRGASGASSSGGGISLNCLVRWRLGRRPRWISGSKARAVVEPVGRGWRSVTRRAVLASDMGAEVEVGHSRCFLRVRNEEELLSCIRKKVEAGKLSSDIATRLEEVFYNYRNAVMQSRDSSASEIIPSNMAVAFDRILLDVENPFNFSPYHKAVREPFDYYMFGQNYFRPLVDFRTSYIGNLFLFFDMEKKLKQGHNIVLFSNHQTEADPPLIALLLERTNPYLAEKLVFVAGDRVITDPLCKPFSMGRGESQIIWIASSGGRDRPDPLTGKWHPASFDESSVDNMRRLVDHSGVMGHMYPLALLCYGVMPPRPEVEKQIGERRKFSFHGVGLSVAPEINFDDIASGCENPEEAKKAFSRALYGSIIEQYNVLESAIYRYQGLNASNSIISLSQPWS
ncbi:glycerol-3-phosphate acyltransferase [Musa troglodytarum]|uniref:glycerol-3-phosphate 1-O-acyltransferase n=1 Tax=Musa troglodytarum TaxID=320322 RepID=A0A9E7JMX7_9LILI|nr:glycerol-3-phosphate acyltransferase [Musa troglodytarum]